MRLINTNKVVKDIISERDKIPFLIFIALTENGKKEKDEQ